jgi:hypothetical protein
MLKVQQAAALQRLKPLEFLFFGSLVSAEMHGIACKICPKYSKKE